MRHATLPADAGIGSNDKDALERAVRADDRIPPARPERQQSGAIKSPMTKKGDGWRPGVGSTFPVGA